jgi:beta-glucosidase
MRMPITHSYPGNAAEENKSVNGIHLGPLAQDFVWASGIEDTFVPQTRPGHRALDEYQLIGHYQHWREDLALAKGAGVSVLRWGVPWYRIEPLPGEFDWRWTDRVIPYMVEDLGITPIIDLMHYGCPFWLRREFANDDYPRAVSAYAAAFAERYKGLVMWYTPLNEPIINGVMCGKSGLWPPYLRGDKGYVRLILQLVRGIIPTVNALKAVDPQARMVHVEATGICRLGHPSLEWLVEENRLGGFLVYDLLTGMVTPDHPLYGWLLRNGATPRELADIAGQAITLDVMGLNFYPQWSTQEVYLDERGEISYHIVEKDGAGFAGMVEGFYRRYGVPIIITETSARDTHEERAGWLHSSLAQVRDLRSRGVPVLGYTWFPLFTMIEWDYRWKRGPLEKYLLELGLYTLNTNGSDNGVAKRWLSTPLLEQFQACMSNPQAAVGDLAVG